MTQPLLILVEEYMGLPSFLFIRIRSSGVVGPKAHLHLNELAEAREKRLLIGSRS